MRLQRHVARELIHLVGGDGSCLRQQYDRLSKILTEGRLSYDKDQNNPVMVYVSPLCGEHCPAAICFADIPIDDLHLHTTKYGRVGLSFLKSFLIKRGANPVFYIEMKGPIDSKVGEPKTREDHFELIVAQDIIELDFHGQFANERTREAWNRLSHWLHWHVLPYRKPFDSSLPDSDRDNYYMDREWRIIGKVSFALTDVYRIILPPEYAGQFRSDFPDYLGQLTFSE